MKKCGSCEITRSLDEFHKRAKASDGRQSVCKSCRKAYDAAFWKKNGAKYRPRKTERRQEQIQEFRAFKETLSCRFCNENAPECLEFHHLDPSQKDDTVSNAVRRGWSKKRLQQEIAKCIVVCANCHRKIHSGRIDINI